MEPIQIAEVNVKCLKRMAIPANNQTNLMLFSSSIVSTVDVDTEAPQTGSKLVAA